MAVQLGLAGPHPGVKHDLVITVEQVDLVRDAGVSLVESYHCPDGRADARQPHEWHDGKKLLALADTLERLLSLRTRRR